MDSSNIKYQNYIKLLESELVVAMGCTEPISLAYASAVAKDVLGTLPIKIDAYVSSNIIKNVKSVVVPNTGGAKGIESAIASGVILGDSKKKLEVLSNIDKDKLDEFIEYRNQTPIKVNKLDDGHIFDILIKMYSNEHESQVRIQDSHTNIVSILFDGKEVDIKNKDLSCVNNEPTKKELDEFIKEISIEEIYDFATTCNIEDVKEILDRQIKYNMAIAEEGLKNQYGANIGKVLLNSYPNDISIKARAYASSASDARMNGCELPVVINSGSGNQGISASVPVVVWAKEIKASKDKLYRALLISNLSTIHIKTGIGRLSAYCGAVAAGCAAGAGISYLEDGCLKTICHTLVNALAITSGIVCDGAKASCAAKISSAVEAGILGYRMYKMGNQFRSGDGIVKKGVENTIKNVGFLASIGMKETDKEIIKIMLDEENCNK